MTDIAPSYETIRKIDVSDKIEKKNGLSYLSWAWALDTLLQNDPNADWVYPESTTFPDGTVMVYCEVTAFGKKRKAHLPVIDYKNQPIKNPNAFQTNTAMQRCLVKAIALHGLGLYIYAGEDLPEGSAEEKQIAPPKEGRKKGKMYPLDKTGNKAVDKAAMDAIMYVQNTVDEESCKGVYTYQYKLLKESGATQEQLDLLEQEKDKHKEYLRSKNEKNL